MLLAPEGALLRLIDARTGAVLPSLAELERQAAQMADASLAMKRAQRDAELANQRVARLEEELKLLRGRGGQADA